MGVKCSLFNIKIDMHQGFENSNCFFFSAFIASVFKAAFEYGTKDEEPIWWCLHSIGKLVLMCGIIV